MSVERSAYLDTSALAKWYLNEAGSDAFVAYLHGLDLALISSLTRVEMRSLLARRRRMGEIDQSLEHLLYAAFLDDIATGALSSRAVEDARFDEAANLMARYPDQPLRTLDALHLAVARAAQMDTLATADRVMANAARAMGLTVVEL